MVGRWRQHCNDDDAVTRFWPGGARTGGCNCGDGGGELPDRPSPTPAPAATAAARPACVSRAVHTRAGRQPTRRPRSRTTPPASGPNAMLVSGSGRKNLKIHAQCALCREASRGPRNPGGSLQRCSRPTAVRLPYVDGSNEMCSHVLVVAPRQANSRNGRREHRPYGVKWVPRANQRAWVRPGHAQQRVVGFVEDCEGLPGGLQPRCVAAEACSGR